MTTNEAIKVLDIIPTIGEQVDALDMTIKALEEKETREQYERWEAIEEEEAREYFERRKQPCEDCISREALRQKLQEHHDFFVNAYGGFSNLPQNDKARVDEISSCIAMVVNEPSVTPQPRTGHWIAQDIHNCHTEFKCSSCGYIHSFMHLYGEPTADYTYCPRCGAKMAKAKQALAYADQDTLMSAT